jgi:hypothetical protein
MNQQRATIAKARRKSRGVPVALVGIIAQVITHPAASFAVKPTLTGTIVVLRPFAFEQDAPALREMLRDPEAVKLTAPGTTRRTDSTWRSWTR